MTLRLSYMSLLGNFFHAETTLVVVGLGVQLPAGGSLCRSGLSPRIRSPALL